MSSFFIRRNQNPFKLLKEEQSTCTMPALCWKAHKGVFNSICSCRSEVVSDAPASNWDFLISDPWNGTSSDPLDCLIDSKWSFQLNFYGAHHQLSLAGGDIDLIGYHMTGDILVIYIIVIYFWLPAWYIGRRSGRWKYWK